jgi:hypothetical protein
LRFNFVVAAHLVSALHSSVFARLASGAFYETIVTVTFYEIIILSAPMIATFSESFFTLHLPERQRYG